MKLLFTIMLLLVAGQAFAYPPAERVRHLKECRNCNLRGAIFSQHDLTGVDLRGANLQYAHFKGTTLTDAKLEGANLRGADFTGAVWIDGKTVCKRGSIGECRLQEQQ